MSVDSFKLLQEVPVSTQKPHIHSVFRGLSDYHTRHSSSNTFNNS
jgi:hypothetical protein